MAAAACKIVGESFQTVVEAAAAQAFETEGRVQVTGKIAVKSEAEDTLLPASVPLTMTSKSSAKENLLGSGGKYHANGDANGDSVPATNGHVNHAFCEIPLESSNGTLKKVRN